jgi:hypothetical protein
LVKMVRLKIAAKKQKLKAKPKPNKRKIATCFKISNDVRLNT